MVFQSYAVWPHMTVFDNVAYGLRVRRASADVIMQKTTRALELVGLAPLADRYATKLSGGQRQRVALARAIVYEPRVVLFDEPLSNLDAKLRVQMRTEIKELHQRLGTTTIYVTHDQIEAMTMGDKIVVMNHGHVEQIGAPLQIYDNPSHMFVAGFIGSPSMNFIEGRLTDGAVETADKLKLAVSRTPAQGNGRPVVYGIRPEHLEIADGGFEAEVVVVEPTGPETQLFARVAGKEIVAVFRERHNPRPGEMIRLRPNPDMAMLFDKETGQRL
jgi:multiple sugar transport system ATP-binding protein